MEELHEDVRSVLGMHFHVVDKSNYIIEPGKIIYMIYLKEGGDNTPAILQKFIRKLPIPYRVVLLDDGNNEAIGFILIGDEDEQEELDSIMEWISLSHSEWMVINCQEEIDVPDIIGYRIANNMFHAQRLTLHGEVLD